MTYNPNAPSAATQAELEAASAVNNFVRPDFLKYHPGIAKAWVRYSNSSGMSVAASHNVSSVTDNGVGDASVVFATNMSSTAYAAVAMGGATANRSFVASQYNTGNVRILGTVSSSGAADDMGFNAVVCFGDHT